MARAARGLLLALLVTSACSSGDDAAGPGSSAPPVATTTTTAPAPTPTTASPSTAAPTAAPTTVATVAAPAGPVPTVEGPITGGTYGVPYNPMPDGLAAEYGYVETEYVVAGTATALRPTAPLGADGVWSVEPAGTGDYRTRILVRRPVDPAAFDGTVVVEWLNVSAGRDSDPDFGLLHPELLARGTVWVGVSAQRAGLEGGGLLEIPGVPPLALAPLKTWDPERYATLTHPGDAFSYDLFSQVGRLMWDGAAGGVDPLAGLRPRHVLAVGESQSAFRLVSYVDAAHPAAGVYDGFLIHSRSGSAAPLGDAPDQSPPPGTRIREDVDVPVLQFQTETDLVRLGFTAARQPDSEHVMTWEVAGTAHADQSTLDYGGASGRVWTARAGLAASGLDAEALCGSVNTGPQAPVLRAALAALHAWVVDGTRPTPSPLLELTADGNIATDADGITLGGIRTPPVDAPSAVLSGLSTAESVFCSLFGRTEPLSAEQLAARYPQPGDQRAAAQASADAAVAAGFLLPADAAALVARVAP